MPAELPVRRRRGARGPGSLAGVLAAAIDLLTAVLALVIVAGIIVVAVRAGRHGYIPGGIRDAARALAGPFDGIFTPADRRLGVALSWGLAALLYVAVGRALASFLRRLALA